ncbi:SDR family oxidoreductase [Spongiactinospora sp. TRM90649]|uniref:SDR family oxidoreductase n=1 Tax=Spongiactinospora sp. TRM90649 TaxID=3031114 RepID=UPI003211AF2A
MSEFTGRKALVTGGGSGIGLATAALLAGRGALDARQPMGRLVTADEVAAAIAYLACPHAGATTGTALAVDGGMQGLRLRPRA